MSEEDLDDSVVPPAGMRTAWCGELRADDDGTEVALCGWVAVRREHGEHLAFIELRDRTGVVQCVVDGAHDLRSEYVVRVVGTVRRRPDGMENVNLATGKIEVADAEVEILSAAEPPPFPLTERTDVDETVRLAHRYVDLRRDRMQRNLAARAVVNSALRATFEDLGFVEIETPMLIASTPEGARDFVVPSRLHPGSFYALPQSPQIFKQLCMVGGVDRYVQIARCLRDEDLRGNRQFEFMQLDMEASFVGQKEIIAWMTEAVSEATEAVTGEWPGAFASMTWHEAMERFGSDKPDTRFGMELTDLGSVFEGTDFRAFHAPCVKGIRLAGGAEMSRKALDGLIDDAKRYGAKGLVWIRVEADTLESPIVKFLSDDEQTALRTSMDAAPGDLLLIVADTWHVVSHVLGLLRLDLGRLPISEGGLHYLWVTEFPLFEGLAEDGSPVSAHHPFTMPHEDDLDRLVRGGGEGLLKVRSRAYDLTVNGWELGSGSVRIHTRDVQERVFDTLGIDADEAEARFGFLLDAFRYGAPPHAGFGMGIDRLVAVLVGEENIREVIAFPKTQSGADPLTRAPTALDPAHLDELGLRTLPPKG